MDQFQDEKIELNTPVGEVSPQDIAASSQVIAGRYKILEEIGRGGMGIVYKVEHLTLHKTMALKLMHCENKSKNEINRFQREAKAASALTHHAIVRVFDFGATENGDLYLVMELIQGQTLSHEIAEHQVIQQPEAIDIFIQICDGMAAAHKSGVLHRDLKPSNIAIERSGKTPVARILDFGIAKLQDSDAENTINKVTQTGEVIGSPAYMSPEQCTGMPVDSRSDIYSMGCVMFEVLTGQTPFVADSPLHILYKHLNERAPLLKSANPNVQVSPELERVVLQALEKDPQNRYQSMNDLAADLALVKLGKNPVKEVARMRNNVRKAAALAKIGAIIALVILAVPLSAQLYLNLKPNYQKELDRAEDQLLIKNNDDAVHLYKLAAQDAIASKASRSVISHILFRLGMFYSTNDQPQSAIDALKQSIAYNDTTDDERAYAYDFLCGGYMDLKNMPEALKYGELALALKHKIFTSGPALQMTANSLWKMCIVYRDLGQAEKAEACAREFLKIELILHPAKDHPYVMDASRQLAITLLQEGKNDEAIKLAEECYALSKKIFEKDNPRCRQIAQWLVEVYTSVGDKAKAASIANEAGLTP